MRFDFREATILKAIWYGFTIIQLDGFNVAKDETKKKRKENPPKRRKTNKHKKTNKRFNSSNTHTLATSSIGPYPHGTSKPTYFVFVHPVQHVVQ